MNKGTAQWNLADATYALDKLRARPFLVDGTLLGAVREGDFIGYDTDVDLGVFVEHHTPEIIPAMAALRFTHHKTFGEPDRGLQYSFKRGGQKVDVFFYYVGHGCRYHAAWLKGNPIRYEYWHFGLIPIVFRERTYLAPDDPERFLGTKYGDDWRTPVRDWDWAWGPKNAMAWK